MATTAPTAPTTGLAAKLAADMATSAVPGMMMAVKTAKKIGMALLVLCLAVTLPHAGEFLSSLPHVGLAGWVIAVLFDLGMLILAQIIQTNGLAKAAKQRATVMLVALGLIAATTQLMAPGETGIKLLFVSVVGLGLGTKWVIAAVKPDFQAIAQAEASAAQTAATIAPAAPKTTGRTCPAGCTCGKHITKKATAKKPATPRKATPKPAPPALAAPTALPRRVRPAGPVLPPAQLNELSDPAVLQSILTELRNIPTTDGLPNN